MGKLGGREMTAASDLDLILVYDFDAAAVLSSGVKPLAPIHYYTRFTQRLISAFTAPTAEGILYPVDMRLRPSGQKGPVATQLSGFVVGCRRGSGGRGGGSTGRCRGRAGFRARGPCAPPSRPPFAMCS